MSSKTFDTAAEGWDKKSRRVLLAGKISSAIAQLPLSKEMDGMEYGCGTGLVGLALAPSLHSLTAIDTSPGMLEVLQEKLTAQQQANVQTLCCDLGTEDYSRKHDLIFCSMTLHHIKDATALLQRFAELLNPGGFLALADLVSEDGSFHGPSAEGIHHHGFDPGKLTTLLGGFDLVDLKSEIIHTITREENNNMEYPVFLLTGRKIG